MRSSARDSAGGRRLARARFVRPENALCRARDAERRWLWHIRQGAGAAQAGLTCLGQPLASGTMYGAYPYVIQGGPRTKKLRH